MRPGHKSQAPPDSRTGGACRAYHGVVTPNQAGASMVPHISVLVLLVDLIDVIPGPAAGRRRGRPPPYPERLFLKALVIMLVRDVATVDGLLAILDQPTSEMRALRERLTLGGRFPSRRTWERRLNALPATPPARIGCPGGDLGRRDRPRAAGGPAG